MTAKSSEYLPGEFWLDPEELAEVCGAGVEELAPKTLKRKVLNKKKTGMI